MKTIYTSEYTVFLHQLRQTRKQVGLTQEQLAGRLGVTQSFIGKCERGERRVDILELRTFCAAMGTTLPEFIAELERRLTKQPI
jgi:transcriptional regulator with XRE-family HTH domain